PVNGPKRSVDQTGSSRRRFSPSPMGYSYRPVLITTPSPPPRRFAFDSSSFRGEAIWRRMMHSVTTPSRAPIIRNTTCHKNRKEKRRFVFELRTSTSRELAWIPGKLPFPNFVKLRTIMTNRSPLSAKFGLSLRNEATGRVEHTVGDNDAVIIVDHGSRRQESNLMLNEFVAMFKARTGYHIVEPAHMDIPSLVADASKEHSGISYVITAPLGLRGLLVDVVNDRINHCLSHVVGDADECSACAGTGKCRLYQP
ncbi:Sirohydrochlorin, partial [Musa troglodytarum]